MSSDCLFCKIVAKQIPSKTVLENDHAYAFHDIHPGAPTHVLVVPKKHITGIHEATPQDATMLGQVMLAAREVAAQLGLHEKGYRLVVNSGADAGQSVFHLHVHVLAGRKLAWPPG
jgi:histidine triad (HIT) family protein